MTKTLLDRKTARAIGALFYFTGESCRNGHVDERYTNDGRCKTCKSEKDRRGYERHAEARIATAAKWYAENRDKSQLTKRAYHDRKKTDPAYQAVRKDYMEKHHERLLALQRENNSTPEAKAAKAAKKKEQAHLYRGYEQKRRARLKGAIPKWYGELDDFVMEQAAELCARRQRLTGFAWEVDHMIPLLATRATGLHWYANLQVIPQTLNRQKNRRMILTQPFEWIAKA